MNFKDCKRPAKYFDLAFAISATDRFSMRSASLFDLPNWFQVHLEMTH